MPTSRVGSFQNQGAVGALNAGLPAGTTTLSPTQIALEGAAKKQSAVQLSASKRINSIKESNKRLSDIAKQVAMRNSSVSGGQGYGGSIENAGRAYTPDGSLSASRNRALALASGYLGTPYRLGGTTTRGIDCSGLVMMVYGQLGYKLPHDSSLQGRNIPGVRTAVQNLRPGDIVAWKNGHHIAIYAGNGYIIEAQQPGTAVHRRRITNYNSIYGIALRLPGE
jgi:cell wall-associated NlpC family hydrolase